MVPFNSALLSLPALGGSPMDMCSVLDQETADLLRSFEDRMMRRPEEVERIFQSERIGAYTDAKVRKSRDCYFELLGMLAERGLLRLTTRRRGAITPFRVQKNSGKQRLVLDCRRANVEFERAPFTEIAAAEAFTTMRVEPGRTVHVATADVEACFYQVGVQLALSEFFCLPSISATEATTLGLSVTQEGASVCSLAGALYLCLAVLPMGWSWAFWIM